jgi:hypothetical protein
MQEQENKQGIMLVGPLYLHGSMSRIDLAISALQGPVRNFSACYASSSGHQSSPVHPVQPMLACRTTNLRGCSAQTYQHALSVLQGSNDH